MFGSVGLKAIEGISSRSRLRRVCGSIAPEVMNDKVAVLHRMYSKAIAWPPVRCSAGFVMLYTPYL